MVIQIKDDDVLNEGKDNGDGETSKDIKDKTEGLGIALDMRG